MQRKLIRLNNLLTRGRGLHWGNHRQIARASFASKDQPHKAPPLCDFIYRAVQFVFVSTYLEARLGDDELSDALAALFASLAGSNQKRFFGLVTSYRSADIAATVARDLCAAMTGATAHREVTALMGASDAIAKTTRTYCQQVFL